MDGWPGELTHLRQSYWFGIPGNPDGSEKYSWVDYATSQGYSVITIDNLGAGASSKANPITEVQQPLQQAILHDITTKLRDGQLPFAPEVDKVIFVGHSLGSVVGNGIATKYPADFDSMIMTGYSNTLLQPVPGLLLAAAIPAQLQDPAKLGSLPPGYLAFDSVGKVNSHYAEEGSCSPALAKYDFAHQDTVTVGQIITAFSDLQRADQYKGDVLVLTGANDAFFCGPTGTRTLGPQPCGVGADSIPAKSKSFFPNANFDYYLAPNTSHATTLHYSTPGSFKRAHDFLAANGH